MIVGFETSGILCSIAWYDNEQILLEYNVEKKQVHSELLAMMFKSGMEFLNKKVQDISLTAIGSGPGSYTGLRIGMSFVKGVCFGTDIPIIGVSNFSVLSCQVNAQKGPFLTLINANKGRFYFARFENPDDEITEKGIINYSDLDKVISNVEGIILDKNTQIEPNKNPWVKFNWISMGSFNASWLCKKASNKYKKFGADNLNELEPLYLQSFAGVL